MKKFSMQGLRAAGFLLGTATLIAQPPGGGQPAAPFVTHQLKPNVYWIEGGGGNSTVIVGNSGVIVVDAKTSKAGGQELLDDISKISPKPITTVILTHSDGDHVNGLAAFPAGLKVIAHENNKKEQEAALAKGGQGAPPADHLPTQVVMGNKEAMTIDGEKLELYHWAPAHTSGDLVVYLPAEKIAIAGDILTENQYPLIHEEKGGTSEGWIATAKGLQSLNADTYVAGHNATWTKAELQKRTDEAIALRNQVREMVAQGKSLDEIKAATGQSQQGRFKGYVDVVYDEARK